MKTTLLVPVLLGLAACGTPTKSEFIDGFAPAALQPGYVRFVTPVIPQIDSGADVMWCQWVAGPSDKDQEVVDVTGEQSKYGHHVVLYATKSAPPVGTSRPCNDADMLSLRFLGGAGGEGATALKLPAGVSFRLPKGYALLANVHFVNVGKTAVEGQAVIDLKTQDASPEHQVADIMTSLDDDFTLPQGLSEHDVNCTVDKDLSVIMWANHMHGMGTAITSEVIRKDGTKETLLDENRWEAEEQFNPRFKTFPVDQPMTFHAGDVIHTRCTWENTAGVEVGFPTEMCVGIGFYIGNEGMKVCNGGHWDRQD
jgi:hypothetical protein